MWGPHPMYNTGMTTPAIQECSDSSENSIQEYRPVRKQWAGSIYVSCTSILRDPIGLAAYCTPCPFRLLDLQGLAVLPVLLSICGPRASVTAPPSPRPSSWMDNWGDNHYDMAPSPSPLHYDDRSGGRGYHDLGGERQGGASQWNWERSGAAFRELWGEEEQAEGMPGGGAVSGSLTLPLASHMQPDGDVVL